ncbi:MAG: hypothetical protein PW734_06755 [Verrucomicrobium sp.]|nr:hypothetical protein [Verrucomicrobium sp.]
MTKENLLKANILDREIRAIEGSLLHIDSVRKLKRSIGLSIGTEFTGGTVEIDPADLDFIASALTTLLQRRLDEKKAQFAAL